MIGRSKYNSFRSIKDRVWQRVNNWKHKFLSPAGKEVLLQAVIQAVPNYHMNVFKLPRKLCKEIAAIMAKFCDARVNKLIDGSRGVWKEELVKKVLTEDEPKIVCSLLISKSGLPDKQIWGYSKDGLFSVKSAYHLEMYRKRREKGEKSEGNWLDWRNLWNLNVPGVVKVFLWKALNDCLPTRSNLKKRKVFEDAYCPICGTEEETITHALWSCRGSMDVWAEQKSPLQKWPSNEVHFYELWDRLLSMVAKMAQTIRNDVRVRPEGGRKGCRWKVPIGEFIKVNWDAGMSAKDGRVGIGVVIKDGK
ncbi:uncharacterized protein LOC122301654 [Carya illinoinensis]|uniref:uncharacterized protein LOC122301654 n=1 Tax=Carya illinoinensis TaxID=32201 RepID=UPI001C71ADD4|nr:uncharacterized protein LOC122301654 [Carya illinoinensis]